MSIPLVPLTVAVLGFVGVGLAFFEHRIDKRAASFISGIAALASAPTFLFLLHIYNTTPIDSQHPLSELGLWPLIVLLLSFITIVGSVLGSRKALAPLIIAGVLLAGHVLLTLGAWD